MHQITQSNIFGVESVRGTPPSLNHPQYRREVYLSPQKLQQCQQFSDKSEHVQHYLAQVSPCFYKFLNEKRVRVQFHCSALVCDLGEGFLRRRNHQNVVWSPKGFFNDVSFQRTSPFLIKFDLTSLSARNAVDCFDPVATSHNREKKEPKKAISDIWEIERCGGKYKTNV